MVYQSKQFIIEDNKAKVAKRQNLSRSLGELKDKMTLDGNYSNQYTKGVQSIILNRPVAELQHNLSTFKTLLTHNPQSLGSASDKKKMLGFLEQIVETRKENYNEIDPSQWVKDRLSELKIEPQQKELIQDILNSVGEVEGEQKAQAISLVHRTYDFLEKVVNKPHEINEQEIKAFKNYLSEIPTNSVFEKLALKVFTCLKDFCANQLNEKSLASYFGNKAEIISSKIEVIDQNADRVKSITPVLELAKAAMLQKEHAEKSEEPAPGSTYRVS